MRDWTGLEFWCTGNSQSAVFNTLMNLLLLRLVNRTRVKEGFNRRKEIEGTRSKLISSEKLLFPGVSFARCTDVLLSYFGEDGLI
jgi:hypothetical protein